MKKGFTLIELLAVIIILSIIAVIAVPIVLNIINDTKENTYARSVDNIIHTAEIFATSMEINNELELDKNIYDKVVNKIDGEKPDKGQVYVNNHGEVALSLRYGEYCYTKSYGEKKFYKEKTEEECITPFYYLKKASSKSGDINYLDGPIKKSEIEKIVMMPTNIVPEDVLGSWDVGVDKDNNPISNKVMAGYKDEDSNGLYEVYIGQEGGVKANVDSSYLFDSCSNLTSLDLRYFNTSNVSKMTGMFNGCSSLTTLDLSSFNTNNVITMNGMFSGCSSLTTLDLSSFNTNNVITMNGMFYGCSSLTTLDLSSFNTNNVITMNRMFSGCSGLTSLDLGNFDTSNVGDMGLMFQSCSSLTSLDLSHFNTSKVKVMGMMFQNCFNLKSLNLTSFDTKNVTDMRYMFYSGRNLAEVLVGKGWTTENADITNLFGNKCGNNVCGTDHVTLVE